MLSLGVFANEVQVKIPGMVCQMCLFGMRTHFKDSVKDPKKDVHIDFDKGILSLKNLSPLTDDEIKARVEKAGYNAKEIIRVKKYGKKSS